VGGAPAYRGFMDPTAYSPAGVPTPLREDAALVSRETESRKGYAIVRTEQKVFAIRPDATHFRYPYVYGPRQLMPREWCIVRRMRDRRPFILVPDGGLTLCTFGYAENLAHAVLLAIDAPEASAGQIYNCGDDESLSLRQVIETLAAAVDWQGELVSMPWELALPARPLVMQPMTTHRMLDLGKIRAQLGYRDVVAPVDGLARTATWLLDNPPEPGGLEETVLQDPFDYRAEDRLVKNWKAALATLPDPGFAEEPGYTLSWEAPGSSDGTGTR
jgi:nucleoside-diphosphate-sugar epimerase